jgi:hypothetical protein
MELMEFVLTKRENETNVSMTKVIDTSSERKNCIPHVMHVMHAHLYKIAIN